MKQEIKPKDHKPEEVKHEIKQEVAKPVLVGKHLKSFDELTGLPIFPEGTKSLLSKHLKQEIWEKLHAAKDEH